ncbi:MAG: hypothetical protein FJ102_20830 [Deltaproteobacteria bacterium]|nr:hypothetical protein [Deltaproteobacteria bacterium]
MRPVDSSSGHQGGPAVRGQARAAEVHQLKAEGKSPSRAHWREAAAATPAVEVSYSPEASASLEAEAPATTGAATTSTEAPAEVAAEPVIDTSAAAAIVAEAIVASSIVQSEPGMYVDVVA